MRFFIRPKARIKIGRQFLGDKVAATAEGYVIYKEYDASDGEYYHWEEWELRGFNDYDSWVEYDHYYRTVTLYQPIKIAENLDAHNLKKGQALTITLDGQPYAGKVKEAGVGTAVRREGTLTYHVFEGDKVAYAEISTPKGTISIENYNEKEKDYYLGKVLSRKQQKKQLGRVVTPFNWNNLWIGGFIVFLVGSWIAESIVPRHETYCTPRTAANQSTDQVVSQTDDQTCYRRTVYGGGGSSGVGK